MRVSSQEEEAVLSEFSKEDVMGMNVGATAVVGDTWGFSLLDVRSILVEAVAGMLGQVIKENRRIFRSEVAVKGGFTEEG